MGSSLTGAVGLLLLCLTSPASGQTVVVARGRPTAVVEALKAELLPQGFKVDHAGDKNALFTLDRGSVMQRDGRVVHIVLELQIRFKQSGDGLEVAASEEAVGSANAGMDFRKPVRSRTELDNLQRLLDKVRTEIEARPAAGDSGVKHDSSRE